MKTGNRSLIEMLEYQDLEQFVVPEIQRDYVWEPSDVLDLLNYILEGYKGSVADKPYLGFIYAYNHPDYAYKYFLIDGQQRITTIFLLLLACYHRSGKPVPEYISDSQNLKLDYKVRQATRDFFRTLVNHCNEHRTDDFNIKDQVWYHKEYDNDRTIQNIIRNYEEINEWLVESDIDLSKFIKFVEDEVRISYFEVEDSRQGEDLYIYMNSRGRQLEPNETLKARFLSTTDDKDTWGAKWEKWQDFFWKHKGAARADADAGFNDFLRMVQVVNMADANYTADEISAFVSKDNAPSYDRLPPEIEQLSVIYDAYQWMAECVSIKAFYATQGESPDYLVKMPAFERRQAYFLRILPVLAFLSVTGCRDEKTVMRFARFFYNVARKRDTIGKDVATQLPIAVKLMLEYGRSKDSGYDVCDLVNYSRRRTMLIDSEEITKLNIYRNAGSEAERSEIEELFWKAEDHDIFSGEISFFLSRYVDPGSGIVDLERFREVWKVFEEIFVKNRLEPYKLTVALLFYGNTWVRYSPFYYENYNCRDWYTVVRSENSSALINLMEDLTSPSNSLDSIINKQARTYFVNRNFKTIEALKNEVVLFNQIKILATLDYYTEQKIFSRHKGYIGKDDRYNYGDTPFFVNSPELFNIYRYVSDGRDGRLMRDMKELLQDENKLSGVISQILEEPNV